MKGLMPSLQSCCLLSFFLGLVHEVFILEQQLLLAFLASQASAIFGVSMHCVERKSTIAANMEAGHFMYYKDNQTSAVKGSM
jgi:hypothetical protein